jgi:hypothetical protein
MALGKTLDQFSPGEMELCFQIISRTTGLDRSWEYWSVRLAKAGDDLPPPTKKAASKRSVARPARRGKRRR